MNIVKEKIKELQIGDDQTKKIMEAFCLIGIELQLARKKHPVWPEDVIHGVAFMAEESGEAVQAAINYVYHHTASIEDLKKELAHTAAMAIRSLVNLPDERGVKCVDW